MDTVRGFRPTIAPHAADTITDEDERVIRWAFFVNRRIALMGGGRCANNCGRFRRGLALTCGSPDCRDVVRSWPELVRSELRERLMEYAPVRAFPTWVYWLLGALVVFVGLIALQGAIMLGWTPRAPW